MGHGTFIFHSINYIPNQFIKINKQNLKLQVLKKEGPSKSSKPLLNSKIPKKDSPMMMMMLMAAMMLTMMTKEKQRILAN